MVKAWQGSLLRLLFLLGFPSFLPCTFRILQQGHLPVAHRRTKRGAQIPLPSVSCCTAQRHMGQAVAVESEVLGLATTSFDFFFCDCEHVL